MLNPPHQIPPTNFGSQWRFKLCDCMLKPSWCLIGYFLPSALIYAIMERTKKGSTGMTILMWMAVANLLLLCTSFSVAYLILGVLISAFSLSCVYVFVMIVECLLVARLRTETRYRYGIEGSEFNDQLISFFCCCCKLHICQMFYESHAREGVELV